MDLLLGIRFERSEQMGKYIVELKKNETLYKAATRESDGTAYVCSAIGTLYTEPDTESIRKRGYDKGLDDIGNALRLLLFQYSNYTLQTIFGYDTARAVVEHFEGSEIVARIRCYEGGVKQDVETIRNEAYQRGLNDAWVCARKIILIKEDGGLDTATYCEIFGCGKSFSAVLKTFTASECIEKIRQYEQEKEEHNPYEDCIKGYISDLCERHDLPFEQLADVVDRMRRGNDPSK